MFRRLFVFLQLCTKLVLSLSEGNVSSKRIDNADSVVIFHSIVNVRHVKILLSFYLANLFYYLGCYEILFLKHIVWCFVLECLH